MKENEAHIKEIEESMGECRGNIKEMSRDDKGNIKWNEGNIKEM